MNESSDHQLKAEVATDGIEHLQISLRVLARMKCINKVNKDQ
jgi:hypothetical protein